LICSSHYCGCGIVAVAHEASPLESSYYIRIRGQVKGPYDPETLQGMARRSQFARHNEVSPDGETWFRASEFPELFPARAERRPVPPRDRFAPVTGTGTVGTAAPATSDRDSTYDLATSPESANEEARWFYGLDGKEVGGVSFSELCGLFKRDVLTAKTFVWNPDIEWTKARNVPELAFLFAVETPAAGPAIPERKSVADGDAAEPSSSARPGRHGALVFQIVLLAGASLMAGSMFLPWWSLAFTADETDAKGKWGSKVATLMTAKDQEIDSGLKVLRGTTPSDPTEKRKQRDTINVLKIVKADKRWWRTHLKGGEPTFEDNLASIAEQVDDNEQMVVSLRLWGWSEGIAIMGCVFGLLTLVAVILCLCLPAIRMWNWVVSTVASLFGLCAIIFSLLWILSAPRDDAGGLTQGIIAGPWLLLGAAVVLFLAGLLDSIFGIMAFARHRRELSRAEVAAA